MIEDFLRLTEDVPPRPADAYESNYGTLTFRAVALLLIPLALALPRMSGKLTLADEEFVSYLSTHPSAAPMRTAVSFESHLAPDHLGYQLTSAAIHAINAVLFWLILRRLHVPGAWLAAAVFSVHPVGIQAVAMLGQQSRLWGAMCFLGSMLLYLRIAGVPPFVLFNNAYEDWNPDVPAEPDPDLAPSVMRKVLAHVAALVLFALGMWFQPTGIVIVVPLLLLVAWSRGLQRSDWRVFSPLVTLALAASVLVVVSHRELGISSKAAHYQSDSSPIGSALTRAGCIAMRAVWPYPPISDAGSRSTSSTTSYLPMIVIFAALVALWTARRRLGLGPVVALVCFVCLIPTLAELEPGTQFLDLMPGRDALGYLAAMPLIAVIVATLVAWVKACTSSASSFAIAGGRALVGLGTIVPLAILTWQAGWAYGDTETLWRAAAASDPRSLRPRIQLAEWYLMQSRVDDAEQQLAGVDPNQSSDVDALLARGRVYEARRNIDDAIRCYVRATQLATPDQRVRDRLADAYASGGDATAGKTFFEKALREAPGEASLLNDYGLFLGRLGDHVAAAQQFRAAIAADAQFAPARINLASMLFERGEFAEAAEQLQAAVKVDPKNFDAFHNAGVILCQLKDFEKAEPMLRVAVRLRPESPEARNDLGVCLVAVKKLAGAVFEFEQALSLRPDYESARQNLRIARQRMISQTQPAATKRV